MENFVALDFETALGKRYSACAVGIVVVENNVIKERIHELIQPPGNEYHYKNIEVHGITPKMTEQSKTFDQFYPILKNYLHKNRVVCHNADFDLDVLSKTMAFYGIEDDEFDFDFHCTFKLYGLGLKDCCKELNIQLDHHNPLSDAEACAELFLRLILLYQIKFSYNICQYPLFFFHV
jgi:DNA polymerase-3 subunit epsilon